MWKKTFLHVVLNKIFSSLGQLEESRFTCIKISVSYKYFFLMIEELYILYKEIKYNINNCINKHGMHILTVSDKNKWLNRNNNTIHAISVKLYREI